MSSKKLIVYVDEDGVPTGETAPKLDAHHGDTKLHLAFSCYIFNDKGEFLATQRALSKKVWPGVWTNSACGHPGPGEDIREAIKRHLHDELGMEVTDVKVVLPNYRYTTPPFKGIVENEFCPVFVARATSQPRPNSKEVEAFAWLPWQQFVAEAEDDKADVYSWWCKDQLKRIKNHPLIAEYAKTSRSK